MARAPFTIEVKTAAGDAIYGANVTITTRPGAATATLYALETGPTTASNPLVTDASGRVSSWVDRGAYTATVSGSGITTYAVPFDAVPGSNASVDATWLAERTVRGQINTTGSGTIDRGTGFTINRTGTGVLAVTFTTAFAIIPTVVTTYYSVATSNVNPRLSALATTGFTVTMLSSANAAVDGVFNFIAIGS